VIVLDEPTAGVDVELRQTLWRFIRRLNAEGHTIVLTTHYLEEAQELCTRIAMLKLGSVVALDETRNLVRGMAGGTLVLRLADAGLPAALAPLQVEAPSDGRVALRIRRYEEVEPILARLREAGCRIEEMELLPTDLEDVFVRIMRDAS
ncbi:MAG: ABC transporter ATP-binding protein, partial [Burkholderiaceae bacterium]